MFKQYKLRNYKFILVMYVVILNVIGILLIGSAKPSVQSKQIFGMIAGLTIMVMLSLIDYNFILKFSWLIYFFMLLPKVTVSLRYFPSIHPSPRFYPKQRSSFQENLEKNHLSANFPMH